MGKLAKPQRSKKHKKIKAVDPFYHGSRKDVRQEGWNQKPKSFEQEVPRKLKYLGFSVDGAKSGKVGKKSKNKFLKHPDGPHKYSRQFSAPLGTTQQPKKEISSKQLPDVNSESPDANSESKNSKKYKKDSKSKLSEKEINNFIDSLMPTRPFVEPFQFRKRTGETDAAFMRRVNQETDRALNQAKIDEKYQVNDQKKMLMRLKTKKGMNEKAKERLKEKKKRKQIAEREKKQERFLDFDSLKDKIEFGDVVHAPPVLSVRPKKASVAGVDRPGLRMPELKSVFDQSLADSASAESSKSTKVQRQIGKSVKRKLLSAAQRQIDDSRREHFIEAYRHLKQSKH